MSDLPEKPPARAAWASPGGFSFQCACGQTTQVVVELDGDLATMTQFAVTCDSCGQAHWITPTFHPAEPA